MLATAGTKRLTLCVSVVVLVMIYTGIIATKVATDKQRVTKIDGIHFDEKNIYFRYATITKKR